MDKIDKSASWLRIFISIEDFEEEEDNLTIEEHLAGVEKELGRPKRRNQWLLGATLLLAGD